MEREYIFRCKVCNKQLVSAPKIQVCGCSNRMEVCDNKVTANDLDKIEIKPSSITLNKEINKTGNYKGKINLHSEIESEILIEVVNESDKEK